MKIITALLIGLGFLVPAFASAKTAPAPKDTTPPSVTSIHIGSSNANPSRAKVGDTVTISFTTSEKIETPIVLVNSRPVFIRAINAAGNSWSASYQVGTNDPVGKAIYVLAMEDMADNVYACTSIRLPIVAYCPTTDGSSVTVYKDTTPPPADTQAPVIAAHATVYATTTGTTAAVSYTAPTATDNVDASVAVSCTPASGSVFNLGTTTVTCLAHDAAGNQAQSTFAVVITQPVILPPPDTQAPVIAAHSDLVAEATSAAGAAVTYTNPTATDNVDASVAVSCTPISGSTFSLGITTVTCTAHDAAGNTAAPTNFNVEVRDTTAPTIAPHANVFATTTGTSTAVSYAAPAATDAVDGSPTVSCNPASGSTFALGTTAVTCTAQDAAGNTTASNFAIVVTQVAVVPPPDTEAPVIAAHADVHATTTETTLAVEYTLPSATDNVDASVAVSCTPTSDSVFSVGTTTVTCSAQDAAGNTAVQTHFLVVVEQEVVVPPPVPTLSPYIMAGQADESYLCGAENDSWRYCDQPTTFSFTDVVGEGVKTIDLGAGSTMGTGTLQTVTLAKDPSYGESNFNNPWLITISCFSDSSYTSACGDWSTISGTIHENSGDGVHWFADFSSLSRTFNQSEYYVMTINDTAWETPVYGSESLQEPYWQIVGLR